MDTLLFFSALLFAALFLLSWLPNSSEKRKISWLVVGLVILASVLALAGIQYLGFERPWQEKGVTTPPANQFDQVIVASFACLGLAALGILGIFGLRGSSPVYRKYAVRAGLFTTACLAYLAGILWFQWPAPWNIPIPSQ